MSEVALYTPSKAVKVIGVELFEGNDQLDQKGRCPAASTSQQCHFLKSITL